MIGLICKLPKWMGGGHKRGVFVSEISLSNQKLARTFQCPRCKRTTSYVTKAAA